MTWSRDPQHRSTQTGRTGREPGESIYDTAKRLAASLRDIATDMRASTHAVFPPSHRQLADQWHFIERAASELERISEQNYRRTEKEYQDMVGLHRAAANLRNILEAENAQLYDEVCRLRGENTALRAERDVHLQSLLSASVKAAS